jgi:hypothetical protein
MIRPRLRALSIGELLDASFRLYRNNFLALVAIAALVLVPYHLLSLLFSPLSAASPIQSGTDLALSFTRSLSRNNDRGPLGFVFSLIVEPIFHGTMISFVALRYQQQAASLTNSFSQALQRAISLIGALMLSIAAILLAAIPAIGALCFAGQMYTSILMQNVFSSFNSSSSPSITAYTIPFVLACVALLLFIPAIVVGARLVFAVHTIMLEGSTAFQGIDRSWLLTRDYIWRVVGLSVVVWLLIVCLSRLPVGGVISGLLLLGVDGWLVAGLELALGTIAEIVSVPFGIIAYTLMFFDLRVRHEALDLVQNELFTSGSGEYDPALGTLPQ